MDEERTLLILLKIGYNNRRRTGFRGRQFVKSQTGARRNNPRKFNAQKNTSTNKQTPVKN